jgi:ABC-type multidrug transport system ATPase subunit
MRLIGVAFRYGRRGPWVLDDVTFDVAPGRIIEVGGANGAGKSTLLRLIAGILRPGRGEITGRPRLVGYAPERFPAHQPYTVAAYLGYLARMRRLPETAFTPSAARLGLTSLFNVPLPELSKSSAQKVGLAQALGAAQAAGPALLVLDEPFAGLDARTRADLPGALAELAAGGATVVVSDHQRCLGHLPDVHRFRVADHTATALPLPHRDHAAVPGEGTAERIVLEVVVQEDEAEAVAAKLRADGYEVRRPPR